MSEPPPIESWYRADAFDAQRARGALLAGVRHLERGEHFVAYSRLTHAEMLVEPDEARRIRGLVHAAVCGVKLDRADVRGAGRQLERARARLAEGAPRLASVGCCAAARGARAQARGRLALG